MTELKAFSYSAPGKMMIAGEYAVLYGFPALVMAMDCRAKTTFTPADKCTVRGIDDAVFEVVKEKNIVKILQAKPENQLRLFEVALNYFYEFHPLPPYAITVDSAGFFSHGQKLGLGSSAAATVSLTAALLRAQTGKSPPPNDIRLHALAIHHRLNDGFGSGADIYASVFGGVFRFSTQDTAIRHIRPWQNPNWSLQPVFAGKSQSTKSWVEQIQKWATQNPDIANQHWQQINEATLILHQGLETQNGDQLTQGIALNADAMRALGKSVKLDILDSGSQAIAQTAQSHGGSAKPSGAGGGDVSLAVVPTKSMAVFREDIEKQGFTPIDVPAFAIGCSLLVQ